MSFKNLDTSARVDVAAISIALDWRARPSIEKHIAALPAPSELKSADKLAYVLHETVDALCKLEIAWLYAGAISTPPIAAAKGRALFDRMAREMRTRRRRDVLESSTGMRAQLSDGTATGIVVVTFVVATAAEIPDVSAATNAAELRGVMTRLGAMSASDLLALEVVWSPADAEDRMQPVELAGRYPELKRMRESTMIERIFCGSCTGPFEAGHNFCPHCGAGVGA